MNHLQPLHWSDQQKLIYTREVILPLKGEGTAAHFQQEKGSTLQIPQVFCYCSLFGASLPKQQVSRRDTGIQLGSDMAATNPATDTTLPNVRLAENFNDFSICTDMHFTVLLNCFTWAVYRISQFLKYPQIRSITSKSVSVVHWALQMLLLTMATEHAHHRKSWSQPPFS